MRTVGPRGSWDTTGYGYSAQMTLGIWDTTVYSRLAYSLVAGVTMMLSHNTRSLSPLSEIPPGLELFGSAWPVWVH